MNARHFANRRYPPVKAGDRFGPYVVVEALPRVPGKQERAAWRCVCGVTGEAYVSNLRAVRGSVCTEKHGRKERGASPSRAGENERLREFGNALRAVLRLEPLYIDERSLDRDDDERRFYVPPVGEGLGIFDRPSRTPSRTSSDTIVDKRPWRSTAPHPSEKYNTRRSYGW